MSTQQNSVSEEEKIQPLWANSRRLEMDAPVNWLIKGWRDFRADTGFSLAYGVLMVLICFLIAFSAYKVGSFTMVIVAMAGFVFITPAMAMGLYSMSCQREKGQPTKFLYCLRQSKKRLGNQMIFAFVLLIVFLIWARAASMVHVFFPMSGTPTMTEIMIFLAIGSVVGSIFAAVIYCASVFALPMMMDRDVDAITAMLSSVNAVLHNKRAMLLWAAIIGFGMVIGFATFFIGLAVILPVIGHASWHGYRDAIDASDWLQDAETRISNQSVG